MSLYDDLIQARELLDRRNGYEPNPYDQLMTEALNSAEETGRVKERARVLAPFLALADELEADDISWSYASHRIRMAARALSPSPSPLAEEANR